MLETDPVAPSPPCSVEEREQAEILHHEINRLPQKYRLPVVLCYFEGMTHDAAAMQLRWPVGTVRGRLARRATSFAIDWIGAGCRSRSPAPATSITL